jgi:hypothetical protein
VEINGHEKPDKVQLGVTYDSGAMVQVGLSNPAIIFMDLKDSSIYPELSPEEFQTALVEKVHTPMHYGIRILYERSTIKKVTIRYKYLGFTKVKNITKWFEK